MAIQTIRQFHKMLKNLDACMVKAAAHADQKKYETNVLANSRLAPDMYPFIKQIQSTCDSAKFCAAYLSNQTPPKHEDNETTWTELHARIAKVTTYLESFKDGDFANYRECKVKPGWAQGKWLRADEYLQEVAIPNFYFHLMAAYAILRHNGVDIGKMDYMGAIDLKE